MDFSRKISIGLIPLLIAFALGSCGEHSATTDLPGQETIGRAAGTGLPELPRDAHVDPAQIAANRGTTAVVFSVDGPDCLARGGQTVIDESNGVLAFNPTGADGAWAVYEFSEVLATDLPLMIEPDFEGGAPAQYYLGLADYGGECWRWIPGEQATGDLIWDEHNAISPGGAIYAVVMVLGADTASLDQLRLDAYPVEDVTGFSASDGEYLDRVELTWVAVEEADGYRLEYRCPAGEWTPLADISDPQVTSFAHAYDGPAGDEAGYDTDYEYRIQAYAGDLASLDWSTSTGRRTLKFRATDGMYPDIVVLSWNAGGDAAGFSIDYRCQGAGDPGDWTTLCDTLESAATTAEHSSVSPGGGIAVDVVYEYRIGGAGLTEYGVDAATDTGYCGVGAGQWTMPGGDSCHTRRSTVLGPVAPEVLWTRDGARPNSNESGPVFGADGTIYIFGADTQVGHWGLAALNPDGTDRWFSDIYPDDLGIAVGADGMLYVTEASCDMLAFNPDGTHAWTFVTDNPTRSSPVIAADGTLYYTNGAYTLFAVNPDGTGKWTFSNPTTWGAPAVGPDGTIYVCSEYYMLYVVNPDGTQRWTYDFADRLYGSPVICQDGTVLVAGGGTLHAISSAGELVWEYATGGLNASDGLVDQDGRIVMCDWGGVVHCMLPSGELLWQYDCGANLAALPAMDGAGTVFFGTMDGLLHAVDADGAAVWSYGPLENPTDPGQPCWVDTDMVIGPNGTLYFKDCEGTLYAIGEGGAWAE